MQSQALSFTRKFPGGLSYSNTGHQKSWGLTLDTPPQKPSFIYGYHKGIDASNLNIGGINAPDFGYSQLYSVDKDGRVLPQLSYFAAKKLVVEKNRVILDDNPISTVRGEILVNILSLKKFLPKIVSLKNVIKYARAEKDLSLVEPGDVVLILPEQLTGTSEYIDTYYGMMPAGLIQASMINSAMSGDWIREFQWDYIVLILFAIFGAFVGSKFQGAVLGGLTVFGIVGAVATGIISFLYFSTAMSWLQWSGCYALSLGTIFLIKSSIKAKEATKIKHALNGMIPAEKIDSVINYQLKNPFQAGICDMSVVFIDIAGFSVAVSKMTTE